MGSAHGGFIPSLVLSLRIPGLGAADHSSHRVTLTHSERKRQPFIAGLRDEFESTEMQLGGEMLPAYRGFHSNAKEAENALDSGGETRGGGAWNVRHTHDAAGPTLILRFSWQAAGNEQFARFVSQSFRFAIE